MTDIQRLMENLDQIASNKNEDPSRFAEIMKEIKQLADEAFDMLDYAQQDRAKGYWYASIVTAVDDDSSYSGQGPMVKMQDSLKSLGGGTGGGNPEIFKAAEDEFRRLRVDMNDDRAVDNALHQVARNHDLDPGDLAAFMWE